MKTQSERPTPRLQDTELQPICRHRSGAQPTGHAQEYRPPQIGSDSTVRRPMLETTSEDRPAVLPLLGLPLERPRRIYDGII